MRRPLLSSRRRTIVWRCAAIAAITAVFAAACTTDSDSSEPAPETRDVGTATSPVTDPPPVVEYSIDWEPVTERIDGGWITVPLDYADPAGPTIDLRVARRRADSDERIGVLFSNNGGPGAAASTIALNASAWFDSSITERFDVVSWDPRGTGESAGVDCIDDDEYDRYFGSADITPETDEERADLVALAQDFANACIQRAGDVLQHIGTNNSARDMDAIRQALGETQVSYFGFSYGSELGGVWTTLFPTTVRAAIFDGASDPNAEPIDHERQQRVGFENALDTFLAECTADSDCDFHNDGDAEAAFDALWAAIDESPLSSEEGRTAVNLGIATTAVAQAMYSERFWGVLEGALRDAANGDGVALLQLRDAYFQRSPSGEYSNLIEAFQAISCADQEERPTPDEDDSEAEQLVGVAPRLFPQTTGSYFCTFFPAALDPRIEITGEGAGPIMVIGTTGDPSTPLASSRLMADSLEDGRLVIVEANEHTGYGVNQCVNDVVDDYLIHLEAPADGTVCA
ncbi:MAG: alpha/beta hydrolase [Acidimicrobiia bacterium]|nr:alpha/beta hydrolase [Acidimicrobiia bacterium]